MQGTSPFNASPESYQVFRNVKDFGAKGDGVTDDTAAIRVAMSTGGRCGGGGNADSSTVTPAILYFPQGTEVDNLDADPYIPGGDGAQWFINQNNFFRSVRNFIIDLRQMPAEASATGVHWQVSQATSLFNVVVEMSTASGNNHQGIWMENGSGGFMSDLTFNGGKYGMWVGNQQFTVRNVTVNNANTAVFAIWNWVNNCQVGFDLATGGTTKENQGVGAEAIIDAEVTNTPIFIRNSKPSTSLAGSLVLNNIHLKNVPVAVGVVGGQVVLKGGTTIIESWAQGNIFSGTSSTPKFVQDHIAAPTKAASLLDGQGRIFGKARPQYEDYPVSAFVSVKDEGAKGDGYTDDTIAIQNIFDKASYAGTDKIVFFDAGTYLVTNTISMHFNIRIVGEIWSTIMGGGTVFSGVASPTPIVKVGNECEGIVEITDMLFTTRGPAGGAIVMQWNARSSEQGGAGMWDTHIRLGGAAGSNLQQAQCPKKPTSEASCFAAHMGLYLSHDSNAYLEGTWVWLADHDLDGTEQITVFSGRGILSQSRGPVWMIGTGSEHHTLYQYNLTGARDHYMGLIQTETPYYQPSPPAPAPFTIRPLLQDPSMDGQTSSWALYVRNSHNILVFGAGLYSFFCDYGQSCIDSNSCQTHVADIDDISTISIFSLSTVGVKYQLSLSTVGATRKLSVNSKGVVPASTNPNGFAATMTAWTR
ncbi:hypothetical protein EUX98_g3028 [Antrodiella citrinella]|uniref:Rhamnogalacturonase A/B/Epimerase-like pectate lyase domain-containing protein n=1 Tax=Antrodiella citrinella TaxID=2447956 RepID=A0A4S4MXJ3_9APHY|nr:hypothetical protein EUX98_g3028 [Antrodiella citrinella]